MVNLFHLASNPQIFFGSGKRSELTPCIIRYGHRIVLLTGANSFLNSSFWPELQENFERNKISVNHHIIPSEPTPEMIDDISYAYQQNEVDAVVAIGGGSVLDAGKAAAAMIGKNETVKNFLEGVGLKEPDGSTLPFIALPTTSGTGSECTKNAVITEIGNKGFKKSLRHDQFVPKIAIVDPELTLGCPEQVTAASGMDAFTQLLESYLSTQANPITDALALSGLEKISENFEDVMSNGQDLKAREGMTYAAMVSGITLANAGLGTVHGFASSVGGYYSIPHGVICGTLMASCNRYNINKIRKTGEGAYALKKYADVGEIFSRKTPKNPDYSIDFLLDLMEKWTEEFKIPRLSSYISGKENFPEIVKSTGNKNNPVKLTANELREILESRF